MVTVDPRSGAPSRAGRLSAVVRSALTAALLLAASLVALAVGPAAADGTAVPALTSVVGPAATLKPGEIAQTRFTLAAPAQRVRFVYANEEGNAGYSLEWTGTPTGSGPLEAVASGTVQAHHWSGAYTLHSVIIEFRDGQATVWIYRNGETDVFGVPGVTEVAPIALEPGDYSVDNPDRILADHVSPPTPTLVNQYEPHFPYLKAEMGAWPPYTLFNYTWLRDGVPIESRSGNTYAFEPSRDAGAMISVQVTARTPGYREVVVTSAGFGPMPRPVSAPQIRIAGTPAAGKDLYPEFTSPEPVTVTPAGGEAVYSYIWKRDGVVVPGATTARYTVAPEDRLHTLSVEVTISFGPGASTTRSAQRVVPAVHRSQGFDLDGNADVFARTAAGELMLYPGDGRGGWLAPRVIGTGWNAFDAVLAPGSFDNSGSGDVIARDAAGRLLLYAGNGRGGWEMPYFNGDGRVNTQIGQGWDIFDTIVPAGDFNGDGTNDLLARTRAGDLVLYPGDDGVGFLPPRTVGWGWRGLDQLIAPGDVNGDGANDVLARDASGTLRLYAGDGKGGFAPGTGTAIGWGWSGMKRIGTAGDFDSDGKPDVFGIDDAGRLTMYFGNGASGWKGAATIGWGWGGFTAVF
ncbi:FG-GAP repeat domain-containing protein [Sinomonas atrocyanea]|uniref:FG-GAP repeat domain-containing protein n=1 Tax=Sinomonas atrocyanea TaxID=37927 RepID=UPI003D95C15E